MNVAVNIRSDEGTEVQYAERIEDLDSGGLPELGFQDGLLLAYGSGTDQPGQDFMGLQDSDFNPIVNDDLSIGSRTCRKTATGLRPMG